jgi:hypothetical protein
MSVNKQEESLEWLIKWGKKWQIQVYLQDYKDYFLQM